MSKSLQFNGEQVAGLGIKDLCDFDSTGEIYTLSFDMECMKWEIKSFNDFVSDIPGYNATANQTLQHDTNGKLLRA